MILPEYLVTEFTTGRYQRLTTSLSGVYVRELVRYIDKLDAFLKMFPEQDHFIATLFFEQQLNPMLKSYTNAKAILNSYTVTEEAITNARSALKNLCDNACTNNLINQIKIIEALENNWKNLQDNFYCMCCNLYPINQLINANITTINNNIQHVA